MSIVCASRLSASDLARLGNNVDARMASPQRRRKRRFVAAVNRSLAIVGEQVNRLHGFQAYPPPATAVSAVA